MSPSLTSSGISFPNFRGSPSLTSGGSLTIFFLKYHEVALILLLSFFAIQRALDSVLGSSLSEVLQVISTYMVYYKSCHFCWSLQWAWSHSVLFPLPPFRYFHLRWPKDGAGDRLLFREECTGADAGDNRLAGHFCLRSGTSFSQRNRSIFG